MKPSKENLNKLKSLAQVKMLTELLNQHKSQHMKFSKKNPWGNNQTDFSNNFKQE